MKTCFRNFDILTFYYFKGCVNGKRRISKYLIRQNFNNEKK